MSIWIAVRRVYAEGGNPVIEINYSMMVKPPRGKAGRPKKPKAEKPVTGYVIHKVFTAKTRPRCLNPSCRKRLGRNIEYVCDSECRSLALMEFVKVVLVLKGVHKRIIKVKDVPDVARYDVERRLRWSDVEKMLQNDFGLKSP